MKNVYSVISKITFGLLLLVSISCDDDGEDVSTVSSGEFALVTSVLNADGRARAFYLQRSSVDEQEDLDNSNATEMSPATGAMVHSYNGSIYFSDYNNGNMVKWDLDESNGIFKDGELSLSELIFQGNTAFQNEETAFVGGLSTSLIIFNPSTMTKTGTIDFSALSKVGESTDFPEAGGTYAAESVSEIIIRDGYLFAALMPLTDITTFSPAEKGCSIIVVDLSKVDVNSVGNTDAAVKRIYDERGSHTGAWGSGGGNPFMNIDENNDIYMLCHNSWANPLFRPSFNPACILKIASGDTDFDEDYYFDVESVSKGLGNGVMNFEYYGNGKFLAAVQDPDAIDPENPFSYFTDPIFQWWSFDLYNKTSQIASEDYTRGALAAVSYFEDGFGYVPYESNGENFVMKIDLNTMEATRQFGTSGLPQLYSLD